MATELFDGVECDPESVSRMTDLAEMRSFNPVDNSGKSDRDKYFERNVEYCGLNDVFGDCVDYNRTLPETMSGYGMSVLFGDAALLSEQGALLKMDENDHRRARDKYSRYLLSVARFD